MSYYTCFLKCNFAFKLNYFWNILITVDTSAQFSCVLVVVDWQLFQVRVFLCGSCLACSFEVFDVSYVHVHRMKRRECSECLITSTILPMALCFRSKKQFMHIRYLPQTKQSFKQPTNTISNLHIKICTITSINFHQRIISATLTILNTSIVWTSKVRYHPSCISKKL